MDYKELLKDQDFSSPDEICEWMNNACQAITELVGKVEQLERQLAEAKLNRPFELSGQGAENFTLAAQLSETQQKLKEVTAERDAAVADVCAITGEVEEIRRGYGVDNADADDAFAGLCESYCANYGHGCYKEGGNGYYCANFKWRGPQKED